MTPLHVHVEGSGPDLVLLHGWGFHSGAWHDVATDLAGRYRVHRVDLPGHGWSADTDAPFDEAVEAIAECVPQGSLVAGWSLGGLFAQRLAARHGSRVRGVLLASSTPCFVQRADWPCAMRLATLEAFAHDLERSPQRTLEQFVRLNALHAPGAREAVRALTQRLAERPAARPAGLRRGLQWLREVDLRGECTKVRLPCVIVHGARDAITPIGAGRWLAQAWPGARLVEIGDAAHLPFVSHGRRFVEALGMLDG
jgi:pimeloyl-[acyl-carrier protein] methyl ester esterase